MGKQQGRLGTLTLQYLLIQEKEIFEFKPAVLYLKIDYFCILLVAEWLDNIHKHVRLLNDCILLFGHLTYFLNSSK